MKNILLVFLFLYFAHCDAQKNILEFESDKENTNFNVFAFAEHGLLLHSEKNTRIGGKLEWSVKKIDDNLVTIDSLVHQIATDYSYCFSLKSETQLHSFFQRGRKDLMLLNIDASTLTITTIDLQLSRGVKLEGVPDRMAVFGDYIFISKEAIATTYLLIINWNTGIHNSFPISKLKGIPSRASISSIQQVQGADEVAITILVPEGKIKEATFLATFKGIDLIRIFNFSSAIYDRNFLSMSTIKVATNKYVYMGAYSPVTRGNYEGLFYAVGSTDKIDSIHYYDYTVGFVEPLTLANEDSNIKKRKSNSYQSIFFKNEKFNQRVTNHDIIPLIDGYLFIGEVYSPKYKSEFAGSDQKGGAEYKYTFTGNYYTHGIITKYGFNGMQKWSKSFDLTSSDQPMHVIHRIAIQHDKDNKSLKLVTSNYDKVMTQIINYDGEDVLELAEKKKEVTHKDDEIRYSQSMIVHWKNDLFLVYGIQEIINDKIGIENLERVVYFMNKVQY